MERIDKIPDNFLMEKELTKEQEIIFLEQINRFNELSEKEFGPCQFNVNDFGKIMLAKDTLIHGISAFSYEKLDNISKSGILTGQAIGVSEDGETYYCADFHRVKEDISVEDYNKWFPYNDGRCPFGKRADVSREVAFIISPSEEINDLLKYDCYRNTTEGLATRSFINYMPMNPEVASSILYGIPANCIDGIVVGGKVLNDSEQIYYLIEKFPQCYILSSYGELIYDPVELDLAADDAIDLRRKVSLHGIYERLNNGLIKEKDKEIERLTNQNNKLMNAMYKYLKNEDIRNMLIDIGWQSYDDEYIESQRKGIGR